MKNTHQSHNLILLHGWGFNRAIWTNNLIDLKKYYSNIINLDLNGHGDSEFNPQYENLDVYLDYLITFVPNGADILGWSLGGIIGLLLKHRYPEHINQVIMCASNVCFINSATWPYGVTQENWDKFYNKLITNQNKALQEFLLLQTLSHPDSKVLFKELLKIHNNSALASIDGLNWGLNILSKDYRFVLETLDQSQLKFIFGKKDLLINANLQTWLQDNYPSIKTYLLEKSSHMPFITESDYFYQCL